MNIQNRLPYPVADLLAQASRAEALVVGKPMAVTIVDAEGGLQLFSRMDGTLPVSTEVSMNKAYTAAILRIPTDVLGKVAQPGEELYGIGNGHNGRIVLFGGGFPLFVNNMIVGAVGVSGGSVQEDMQVARPAVMLLSKMESLAKKLEGQLPPTTMKSYTRELLRDALKREFLLHMEFSATDETISALVGGIILALM